MLPPLDALLHAPARLQLVTFLAAARDGRELTFAQLQHLTGTTAGNLSTHLRKLEDAGVVAVTKAYDDRTPVTRVAMTTHGRRRYDTYTWALAHYLDGRTAAELLEQEVGT